jgi:carbonic anhydrase
MSKHLRACALAFAVSLVPLTASAQVAWNHNPDDAIGPNFWGSLSFPFATCGSQFDPVLQEQQPALVEVGRKQTPIVIATADTIPTALPAIVTQYVGTPFIVENTGHVIEVPVEPGSSIRVGQDGYQLLQFHLHAPSEHMVDGKPAAAELHLVHRNALLDLAVVGVMIQVAPPGVAVNAAIETILANAPDTAGKEVDVGGLLNPKGVLPQQMGYYTYSGSLTTPPCSEGVRWFVLKNPVFVSQAAIDRFHEIIGLFPGYTSSNNNRPVRPLNGRAVLRTNP